MTRKCVLAVCCLLLPACGTEGTGLGLNLVPDQQVQEMALETWKDLRAKTPVSADRADQRRARTVADRVLQAAGEQPAQWEVVVFQGGQANAFALPGGKIGVYDGMLRLASSDEELAAVIGHEIAHNEARHAAQRVNSQTATKVGIDIASAALGAANVGPPDTIAGLLGVGAQYGVLLPYSRNQELEADRLGLTYMAKAGYDPHGAVALWRKMQQQGGSRQPTFLSTHPAPGDRIAQLESLLPEAMTHYHKG